ncbi:hypothetical protein WNY37_16815 [Henriciella sp. AS95]|uniref:hypothetical protein n=1 Tax=Henriciella sp. AS95 TaxID=3135782 RepID=UPI00317438E8
MRILSIFILCCTIQTACVSAYRAPDDTISDCPEYVDKQEKHFKRYRGPLRSDLVADAAYPPEGDHAHDLHEYNKILAPKSASARPIIVRYSEGGDLVSRCDYSLALNAIKHSAPGKRLTVLVYVHGWNNDSGPVSDRLYNYRASALPSAANAPASPESCNLIEESGSDYCNFSKLLERHREKVRPDEAVIGIYLSWKGSSPIPYLDYFSRRSGADKLSRGQQIPRILGAIESLRTRRQNTKVIYFGHSMGARILYNAVAQDMLRSIQMAYPEDDTGCHTPKNFEPAHCTYELVEPTADLVFLINPAFEAASYKALDEFRTSNLIFQDDQSPLIVTLQGEGDWPTKTAFALAEGVGLLNDPGQSGLRRVSVGHHAKFRTHELKPDDECVEANTRAARIEEEGIFCAGGLNLEAVEGHKNNRTPFIIASIPKNLMPGHSWFRSADEEERINADFNDWLSAVILSVRTPEERAKMSSDAIDMSISAPDSSLTLSKVPEDPN